MHDGSGRLAEFDVAFRNGSIPTLPARPHPGAARAGTAALAHALPCRGRHRVSASGNDARVTSRGAVGTMDIASNAPLHDEHAACLIEVAGGDRAAFERLYRAMSPRLLGICARLLSDRAEAEDVLQDVFVSIWRKAPQFDPARSTASAWLGSIARNRAIDRLRATPGTAVRAPFELADGQADADAAPAAMAEAEGERHRLEHCIGQLESKRRQLIRTAFFDGATYEDLATRCGSPLGSVKSWIRRGLAQLRACLES